MTQVVAAGTGARALTDAAGKNKTRRDAGRGHHHQRRGAQRVGRRHALLLIGRIFRALCSCLAKVLGSVRAHHRRARLPDSSTGIGPPHPYYAKTDHHRCFTCMVAANSLTKCPRHWHHGPNLLACTPRGAATLADFLCSRRTIWH